MTKPKDKQAALKKFFADAHDASSIALMVIDPQKYYCHFTRDCLGTEHTEDVAMNLLSLVTDFKQADDILRLGVYMDYLGHNAVGPQIANRGFYRVKLEDFHVLHQKSVPNAFYDIPDVNDDQNLEDRLKKHGITHAIVAGYFTNLCVKKTVIDGLEKGFNFAVVEDCCSNKKAPDPIHHGITEMQKAGAIITDAASLKPYIR